MDQISQIKQAIDITALIGGYVALQKSGKNYKGLCPFHSEKTPSFMVSPELQIFRCFGCGEAGDIFQFIQKIEGVDFYSALTQLADKAGIKLEKGKIDPEAQIKKQLYWINDIAARFYNYILIKHSTGESGRAYFKRKRGLTDKTIETFTLGYAPDIPDILFKYFSKKGVDSELLLKAGLVFKKDNGEYCDKFRGRVMFPLTGVDGKTLGFAGRTIFDRDPKYLNISETPVYHKSFFIYGLDHAKVAIKKDGAVLVEGYMDVISPHEAGITNVIASSGTSLTLGQLKLLARYTNNLVFCFDSDAAGVLASFRGIELAENMGFNIKVAIIPAGFKDLDELVKSSSTKATDIFVNAVPAYDFLLFSIIKKYNKDSPDGKKKIIDEIVPWFSRIKNQVLVDYYAKEIAKELDLNEETVFSALNTGQTAVFSTRDVLQSEEMSKTPAQSVESYIITLLFKAGLDFMRLTRYKVEPQDFADEKLQKLLEYLREYIKEGIDTFDPKHFENELPEELKAIFVNLYLQDIDFDSENLEKEFNSTLVRLKKESAKRRMHHLSTEIKLAERSNDLTAVKKLTSDFEELKNQLVEH